MRLTGEVAGRGVSGQAQAPCGDFAYGQRRGPETKSPDLPAYRAVVADLLAQVAADAHPHDASSAEAILARRLDERELAAVLSATPQGAHEAAERLLLEVRNFRPERRGPAPGLLALIRICLLAQIDVMWWGDAPFYLADADVLRSADLLDLDPLRRRGLLRFRYRRQARDLLARTARAAGRRLRPGRAPQTAGLRFARARGEAVALLNQVSREFAAAAPPGTPPLWVTSLARSLEHQHRLRALGYAALLPSSHCTGHATDVEMAWFRRFGAHRALQSLLLDRQRAGTVNVIDEGQVWHVCISPGAVGGLRGDFEAAVGG
jgi:hypothetical protein